MTSAAPDLQTDLQALRDELTGVTATLGCVHERLTEITRRLEEECVAYRAKIVALEAQNREILTAAKWLRVQNIEMERLVGQRKPEIDRAIEARDAAFRKLHHSRKVIRDLLEESKMGFLSQGDSKAFRTCYHHTQAREQAENFIKSDRAVQGEDNTLSDLDSDDTVRLKRDMGIDLANHDGENQTSLLIGPSNHEQRRSEGIERNNLEASPKPDSKKSLSLHSRASSSDHEVWTIQYSKPPSSTELTFGPLTWDTLPVRLGLDKETMDSLEALGSSTEHCLRLHLTRDMAFLYDPIFLESPSASYIIDWGRKMINQKMEMHLNQGVNPVFHTFVFPKKKDCGEWFYVGAHTWIVAEVWKVWPTLSPRSKQDMTKKLMGRCNGNFDESAIAKMLDDGTFEQFCVHISATSHRDESRNFAWKIGYRPRRGRIAEA